MPQMAERGGGAVIVISSIAGIRGTPTIGVYGISKAADTALVRNIAVEWGRKNIRANCIAPGLVKTDFARALWENPAVLAKRVKDSPIPRIGEPGRDRRRRDLPGECSGQLYDGSDLRHRWRRPPLAALL